MLGESWHVLHGLVITAWPETSFKPFTLAITMLRVLKIAWPRAIASRAGVNWSLAVALRFSQGWNSVKEMGLNGAPVGFCPMESLIPMKKLCAEGRLGQPGRRRRWAGRPRRPWICA